MSWGEEQKKEIETIRERKITVKLSDADCDRLARKCGEHGLTIGELIENFVGDLVGGTYSNGSDERDYNVSAQKTPAVRKNVRGMNAPITNNATIIPIGFSSGIVGFSWPDVLQNAVIRCIALLFQEKHFR